jgi:hypothetical protein
VGQFLQPETRCRAEVFDLVALGAQPLKPALAKHGIEHHQPFYGAGERNGFTVAVVRLSNRGVEGLALHVVDVRSPLAGGGAVAPVQVDAPSASMVLKALFLLAVTLVYVAALFWTFVLQVITLAEVQHFSVPRSLGSIVVWVMPLLLLSVLT